MRTLVVYDSEFGNTERVARAVAEGLSAHGPVDLCAVSEAPARPDGYALLVVGGPTHGHGLSTAASRRLSDKQRAAGALASPIGLREWLDGLDGAAGTPVAAFDTRFAKPAWLTGSAARSATKRLRAKGLRAVADPESFFVASAEGPLAAGELERARRWGGTLGLLVQAATST